MHPPSETTPEAVPRGRWLRALKLHGWPKLLTPWALGVGIAARMPAIEAEFEACGVPYRRRIGVFEECVEVMKRLRETWPMNWPRRSGPTESLFVRQVWMQLKLLRQRLKRALMAARL